jgi:DNA helicase-2/ATP-dependent DNA helicase PcrA
MLIKRGVSPASILAITFTNKAANEMKLRIAKEVGSAVAKQMTICTFHSLCARMIRENALILGYTPQFSIYDDDDTERALKMAIYKIEGEPKDGKELPVEQKYVDQVKNFIEASRNSDLNLEMAISKYPLANKQLDVVNAYYAELKKSNAVDFTGLLSEALRLLRESKPALEKYQQKWRFISVDEVQDTNISQYQIVKLLGKHNNVLCVGDYDQSIYKFRFAEPQNVFLFEKDFKATTMKLETNYRSTPQILAAAHNLILHNKERIDAELKTPNPDGQKPYAVVLDTDNEMALWIARQISGLLAKREKPQEIAVFYRINYASRILEKALRQAHIPFKVQGDVGFFKRKEIKGSLAILRLMANPNDKTAFEIATGVCCKGVGPKTCSEVYDYAEKNNVSIMQSAATLAGGAKHGAKKMAPFTANYSQSEKPYDVLTNMLERTDFSATIAKDSTPDNDRKGNVKELVVELQQHMASGGTLEEYLQYVALLTSADDKGDDGKVRLMSMHRSKGLEFDNVIISHANSSLLPHSRCLASADAEERRLQVEEERRLVYVAMTRARKRLYIAACNLVNQKYKEKPSKFISEAGIDIDYSLCKEEDYPDLDEVDEEGWE